MRTVKFLLTLITIVMLALGGSAGWAVPPEDPGPERSAAEILSSVSARGQRLAETSCCNVGMLYGEMASDDRYLTEARSEISRANKRLPVIREAIRAKWEALVQRGVDRELRWELLLRHAAPAMREEKELRETVEQLERAIAGTEARRSDLLANIDLCHIGVCPGGTYVPPSLIRAAKPVPAPFDPESPSPETEAWAREVIGEALTDDAHLAPPAAETATGPPDDGGVAGRAGDSVSGADVPIGANDSEGAPGASAEPSDAIDDEDEVRPPGSTGYEIGAGDAAPAAVAAAPRVGTNIPKVSVPADPAKLWALFDSEVRKLRLEAERFKDFANKLDRAKVQDPVDIARRAEEAIAGLESQSDRLTRITAYIPGIRLSLEQAFTKVRAFGTECAEDVAETEEKQAAQTAHIERLNGDLIRLRAVADGGPPPTELDDEVAQEMLEDGDLDLAEERLEAAVREAESGQSGVAGVLAVQRTGCDLFDGQLKRLSGLMQAVDRFAGTLSVVRSQLGATARTLGRYAQVGEQALELADEASLTDLADIVSSERLASALRVAADTAANLGDFTRATAWRPPEAETVTQ